jgi:acyl CoA:acetate/3-ketoacid CoA transferase beta subunit
MDTETMICAAASELRDRDVVFVGIGLPSLACNLARATHAPSIMLIYESGTIGTRPDRIPLSIGDPALVTGALMIAPMADVFQLLLQRGHIDIGSWGPHRSIASETSTLRSSVRTTGRRCDSREVAARRRSRRTPSEFS